MTDYKTVMHYYVELISIPSGPTPQIASSAAHMSARANKYIPSKGKIVPRNVM